jgi:HD-GYP domain-containing protein (c-di-GMP phosphodiesterase class II)/DNA-binding CsgD family transcriptional regulator
MLRLAELLGTVSLASDLAHDVPAESALKDGLVSLRLAHLAGWPEAGLSDLYYLALLYHVGCTAAVAAQARMAAGDDVAARRWLAEVDFANPAQMVGTTMTRIASRWGPAEWARGVAGLLSGGDDVNQVFACIADCSAQLAERLGAGTQVADGLRHAYARWDGRVFHDLPSGEELSQPARLVHLVHVALTYHHVGGIEAADQVVRDRRGGEFDPELARLWLENSREIVAGIGEESVWEQALAAEPRPHRLVSDLHLDAVTRALADFVDLKSPYMHGHSPRMGELAELAARELGLSERQVVTLRRAAQIHDLGNVSVPLRVWVKSGALNHAEWTRVRLHPYHSQRIASVSPSLRDVGALVGLHHERLDGSGYPGGHPAASLPPAARLLAAVEMYQSITEPRSWRAALSPPAAAVEVRRMAADGRLDRAAVDAVLAASGQGMKSARGERAWPAGLTDREVDVLRLLARGNSNRRIAQSLHVSEATVHTHVINLYGKAGVNTRAGATLFALEHDLIQVQTA